MDFYNLLWIKRIAEVDWGSLITLISLIRDFMLFQPRKFFENLLKPPRTVAQQLLLIISYCLCKFRCVILRCPVAMHPYISSDGDKLRALAVCMFLHIWSWMFGKISCVSALTWETFCTGNYSQKQAHIIFQYLPPQCLQFMLSPFKTFQCSSLHICRKFRAINSALAKDMHFFFYYSASSILVSTESKCISPIGSWDRVAKVNGYLVVG